MDNKNTALIKAFAFVYTFLSICAYFIFALILGQANPFNWGIIARLMFLLVLFTNIGFCWRRVNKSYKKLYGDD